MFANTITLTINAVAKVLNRINQDNYGSEYSFVDGTESIVMKIRHSTDSSPDSEGFIMKRHNVYIEHVVFATPSSVARKATYTATLRLDKTGVPAMCSDLAKAAQVWIASGTVAAELVAGNN